MPSPGKLLSARDRQTVRSRVPPFPHGPERADPKQNGDDDPHRCQRLPIRLFTLFSIPPVEEARVATHAQMCAAPTRVSERAPALLAKGFVEVKQWPVQWNAIIPDARIVFAHSRSRCCAE